jgi:hypothetical protein
MNHEAQILETWRQNAGEWIKVIAEEGIESRKKVTNAAILNVIKSLNPRRVWDIGCGEGWLCHRLESMGIACMGTDAIPALIEAAKRNCNSYFEVLPYGAITTAKVNGFDVDTFVFNFSLFENESVAQLFKILAASSPNNAKLVVQTLHPFAACGDGVYQSGWREGSWTGIGTGFVNPAPWYYRTLGDWLSLIHESGFPVVQLTEPIDPDTGKPVSAIFSCKKSR